MASTNNPGQGAATQQGGATGGGTVGATLGQVADAAQGYAASAMSGAQAAWGSTMHRAQGAGHQIAGTTGDALTDLTRILRQYPMVTLAIGATAGLLLARLLTPHGASGFRDASLYHPGDRYGRDNYPYAK